MGKYATKIPLEILLDRLDNNIAVIGDLISKVGAFEGSFKFHEYKAVCSNSASIIAEFLSKKEAERFLLKTRRNPSYFGGVSLLDDRKFSPERCKESLMECKEELKSYRQRIIDTWKGGDQPISQNQSLWPFMSKSFSDQDRAVNDYFEGILKALKIQFETGERYSSDSIPQKVRDRIHRCDLMILILTRRDKLERGGYTAPAWLIKEVGHAQQEGKPVIALVERGIRDDAGLKMEKELIYFERDSLESMQKATVKFLEALKEHKLV